MHVDHLQNSRRIRTIPFLDTSLPTAYDLESIRKGSRVFVDPSITDAMFGEQARLFYRWRQITGHGEYGHNVSEYLWPAMAYDDEIRLANITRTLHKSWRQALSKKQWAKEDYFERVLHMDETVKLFIRTSSRFCTGDRRRDLLFSLLPDVGGDMRNATYEWGVWFQAMKALVEGCDPRSVLADDIRAAFETVKEALRKSGYLQHFMNELEYPDYAGFRDGLCALDLHHVP